MPDWPHAPVHRLDTRGAYMVTAGTYRKEPFFSAPGHRDLLCVRLLDLARQYGWLLQAWAVLANHYHFVAISPDDATTLRTLVRHLHSETACHFNRLDGREARKVWHAYWDTHLTFERSYLPRLRYVNENAVHHGLARAAVDYPWCSARWFEGTADAAFVRTVASFKIDHLAVRDDF